MKEGWDVIVIGAGPAGSATAMLLAKAGIKVLLADRKSFPRDKSCGDGLTPYSVRLLNELGVGPALEDAHRIKGVRVVMHGRRMRDFSYGALGNDYNYGLVMPRVRLDDALRQAAIAAGAHFESGLDYQDLLWNEERVAGVKFRTAACMRSVHASMVVGANGAATAIWRDSKLRSPKASPGFAIRGYFSCPRANRDMLAIALPLTDSTNSYVLPSYGWVFPAGDGIVNIGVGLFEDVPYENISNLYSRFVARMTREEGLAPGGVGNGKPWGAPLRFDFSPDASACPGLLLVGDAAGLVSPFTGEGISYALESGRLAAEVIVRCLATSGALYFAHEEYKFLLGHKFAGYFEAGQKSARRYQLLWHVIESTFDSERPVYDVLRRLALVPEGAGSLSQQKFARDLTPLLPPGSLPLRRRLFKVGARLVASLRNDWPFLSRLEIEGRTSGAIVFRPSVLFLACATLGSGQEEKLVNAATALDLSYLAIFAQSGIEEEPAIRNGVNWGNKFSVLLSDFLLSRAFEFCSELGRNASSQIMISFESAYAGSIDQQNDAWNIGLGRRKHLAQLRRKYAPLFVLPCTLAASVAHVSKMAPTLARYGGALGLSYVLTEDLQQLTDPGHVASSVLGTDYASGVLSLPVIEALKTKTTGAKRIRDMYLSRAIDIEELRKAIFDCGVLESVREMARGYAGRAEREMEMITKTTGTTFLARLPRHSMSGLN
ncbi:geranylgeranyl reductase family protein [Bradyrhizobium lablabi]|uniref:geranylgeranyl reductase family protein n=1 Tax=Bradyrhizobium lablabi TaxID=722472 RepID=UPI001BAE1C4E|nr:geranylgeranyl reductase family protein [Bradyrhizobium lablabi]MBR0696734.1 geranylgeranyl reductase family protein [Bradyrhizobium lablabi]